MLIIHIRYAIVLDYSVYEQCCARKAVNAEKYVIICIIEYIEYVCNINSILGVIR